MLLSSKLTQKLVLVILSILISSIHAQTEGNAKESFTNEKAILFNNGEQSVKAFEGSIQVPENRNNPKSRFIPLEYIRFPGTGKRKGSPIIYLSGGPGGSGISTAEVSGFRFPLFMALREFGDVIALDQRGTGRSRIAPKCVSKQLMPLNQKITRNQIRQLYRSAAKECVSFWNKEGVDVLGYTSIQSALDLDQLRKHFRADKITLWGISYGSHLALTALKIMPDRIDKVVIASAEGLDQTVKLPARTDAYFDRLQLAINKQPKAAKTYPNIKALMRRVHKSLENKPLTVMIQQDDGSSKEILFQAFHMQGIASALIADPTRGIPKLLGMYNALDKGIIDFLPKIIRRVGFDDPHISFDVMSFAMDIASGMSPEREKLVKTQSETSLLADYLNFPMPQLNKVVKDLDLGDDFRDFPRSNVPTLLLTGTLDGRTYIEGQKEATQGLSNLTQVIVNNAGHNLFMLSPRITKVIRMFLKGDKVNVVRIDVTLPPFVE